MYNLFECAIRGKLHDKPKKRRHTIIVYSALLNEFLVYNVTWTLKLVSYNNDERGLDKNVLFTENSI